jgi:hypothetical protein
MQNYDENNEQNLNMDGADIAATPETNAQPSTDADIPPEGEEAKGTALVVREPGAVLTAFQLSGVAPTTSLAGPVGPALMDDTAQFYRDFDPRPGGEAALARAATGLTNLSMTSLGRAAETKDLAAFEINAKYGIKAAEALVKVVALLDRAKSVTVANVNVGSGGQAIVGPVTMGVHEKEISNSPRRGEDDAEDNG